MLHNRYCEDQDTLSWGDFQALWVSPFNNAYINALKSGKITTTAPKVQVTMSDGENQATLWVPYRYVPSFDRINDHMQENMDCLSRRTRSYATWIR